MNDDELLLHLQTLEVLLHQPEKRTDAAMVSRLIHEDFFEIGRSGTPYNKAQIIQLLESERTEGSARIWSQDYRLHLREGNAALLVYKSAHLDADQGLMRHALRSSLWQCTDAGWQMIFHQGTPTAPFAAAAVNASQGKGS
ncbi:nuclear transport factor 2 family protein [Parachitinimonas caeni]|uniref:DUF4440 domain-containing protein n=1 Tax=Parachitinimonas caeni TaxID=3031301 RepID=A0ABT7E412_9NEIS|nr:DUF4440 domain-containing protein [Parachitinimonas caeni]MDK2126145.1 DUF4440 domain-containing protein [Parachitinimonas caeni]